MQPLCSSLGGVHRHAWQCPTKAHVTANGLQERTYLSPCGWTQQAQSQWRRVESSWCQREGDFPSYNNKPYSCTHVVGLLTVLHTHCSWPFDPLFPPHVVPACLGRPCHIAMSSPRSHHLTRVVITLAHQGKRSLLYTNSKFRITHNSMHSLGYMYDDTTSIYMYPFKVLHNDTLDLPVEQRTTYQLRDSMLH